MLLSANAKHLMLGYLLGAYTTTIGLGMVIVAVIPDSGVADFSKTTISPGLGVALGLIALGLALSLYRGPTERAAERRERHKQAKAAKGPPRWQRALDKGSAWEAYGVGLVLSLPGASYLVAMDILHNQDLSGGQTLLAVIAFSVIMLLLIEVPVVAFAVAPGWAQRSVDRFQAWIHRDARWIAFWVALVVGVLLIVRAAIEALV